MHYHAWLLSQPFLKIFLFLEISLYVAFCLLETGSLYIALAFLELTNVDQASLKFIVIYLILTPEY